MTRALVGYYDGYSIGTITIPNSPLSQPSPTISIQKSSGAAARIDELRFWNSTLTSGQVSSELFIPVALPSTNILASFGFDTGAMPIETDDNGGAWTINLDSVAVPGSNANVFIGAEGELVDVQVPNTANCSVQGFTYAGTVYMNLCPDTSSSYELVVSAADCDSPCAVGTDPIRRVRLSPFIRLSSVDSISTFTHAPIEMKIPFDSHSSQIDSRNNVMLAKEVLQSDGTYSISLFQPVEVNMELGYVRAFLDPGASYFVTLPDYLSAIRVGYDDQNLSPSVVNSNGFRWYYLFTGSASQYSLNITSGLPNSATVSCESPVVGTFNTTNISFSGLPSNGSKCEITYTYNLNGFSTTLTDMIVLYGSR